MTARQAIAQNGCAPASRCSFALKIGIELAHLMYLGKNIFNSMAKQMFNMYGLIFAKNPILEWRKSNNLDGGTLRALEWAPHTATWPQLAC